MKNKKWANTSKNSNQELCLSGNEKAINLNKAYGQRQSVLQLRKWDRKGSMPSSLSGKDRAMNSAKSYGQGLRATEEYSEEQSFIYTIFTKRVVLQRTNQRAAAVLNPGLDGWVKSCLKELQGRNKLPGLIIQISENKQDIIRQTNIFQIDSYNTCALFSGVANSNKVYIH